MLISSFRHSTKVLFPGLYVELLEARGYAVIDSIMAARMEFMDEKRWKQTKAPLKTSDNAEPSAYGYGWGVPGPTTAELLPWSWKISPQAQTTKCPPFAEYASIFIGVNIVAAIVSAVFGNRRVVRRLTCGLMGKPLSRSFLYMWIVTLALNLGANAINAWLIKKTPGYDATFGIGELVLLFCLRPRVGWIVLGLLGLNPKRSGKGKTLDVRTRKELPMLKTRLDESDYHTPSPRRRNLIYDDSYAADDARYGTYDSGVAVTPRYLASDVHPFPSDHDGSSDWYRVHDYTYAASVFSSLFAEYVLQVLSLIPLGKTVHLAATKGYYRISSPAYESVPFGAHMMYSGALAALLMTIFLLVSSPVYIHQSIDEIILNPCKHRETLLHKTLHGAIMLFPLLQCGTLWIFWSGLFMLAGRLYCPPYVVQQGGVWAGLSSLGIIVGAGF
ncbi:uncharacterized protein BDR25DRAFT_380904 [Lindgomyces ingoldianus]|uniref:Uncharacterized protein n=1 Tax=Lindgomyces ingoldianus TaxID=673940 RepID=A0ACB6QCD3_9PLEO|nr:uncharacterized protein BDR25DRAFT_380904 [Lindgomyces ingoldianus]KAF2464644.1 hypothetical protein BDR25DRAFT_380904 [Lindgomyces ingoldianus]